MQLRYRQATDSDDHQYLGRVDHRLSDRHSLYGRFWVSRASTPPVLEPGNAINSAFGRTWQNTIVSVNDNLVLSPRLVNNTVVTFNRTNNYNFHILPPDYASLGISDVYNDDAPQWFFNVSGYFGINTGDTNTFLRNELQVVNTTRWSLGTHELSFGADYAYGQGDIVNNFRANGRYTFSGAAPFSGDALADFMLGKFSTLRAGHRRVQEHAAALDRALRPGQLPRQLEAHAQPRCCATTRSRRTPTPPGEPRATGPGVESQVYTNAPIGAAYPGDAALPGRRLRRRLEQFRSAPRRRLRPVRRRPHQRPRRLRHLLRPAEHHHHQLRGQPGAVRHGRHVPGRQRQLVHDDVCEPGESVPGRSVQRAV